ncbi:MAG: hypothetical protein JWO09_3475 [Bacteroidetes bacterium]|nr:hypothetical protein [Bacteroidota bacterium]
MHVKAWCSVKFLHRADVDFVNKSAEVRITNLCEFTNQCVVSSSAVENLGRVKLAADSQIFIVFDD